MEKAFVHVLRDMLRGERQVKKTSYFLSSSHWGMPKSWTWVPLLGHLVLFPLC